MHTSVKENKEKQLTLVINKDSLNTDLQHFRMTGSCDTENVINGKC